MTLTEFLLDRIADDEAVARRGSRHNAREVYANDNYGCLLVDPARVLAECEAKRRIVQLHGNDWNPRGKCQACDEVGPCDTLRALALPYADHGDFQEVWHV